MLKLTRSKFELDLTNYDISISEKNYWFEDRFFAKSTLPFSFIITDEINKALGDILSHNSVDTETYLEAKLTHNGKIHDAILDIEQIEGRLATASIRFGYEELPNFKKKLPELPLDDFDIVGPETIYTHADDVITKTWPEVSHNFVAVHTNKFDTSEEQWEAFEGLLNKRAADDFVINEYDAIEDKQLNRNIMQPQPYVMHVLTKGFEDAGFLLAGDFTEDAKIKKMLFSEISSYYSTINTNSEQFTMNADEHSSLSGYHNTLGSYDKTLAITSKGRYKIAGNIIIRRYADENFAEIKFNGERIWFVRYPDRPFGIKAYSEKFHTVNVNVEFLVEASVDIEFISKQYIYQHLGGEKIEGAMICDLSVTQLAEFDGSGNLVPTLITPNKIKLNKCVPDITFGKLITEFKKYKNLDIFPNGDTVYMNFIENQLEAENPVSLVDFEVEEPLISLNKGKTFLLKFHEFNSEEYTFEEMFVSQAEALVTGFVTDENTTEIIINALPLPIINKSGIVTADHFVEDKGIIKLILFNGQLASGNLAESNADLLIPSIYEANYKKWLGIRINSRGYEWSFKISDEKLKTLLIRSKVMAYKRLHVIKSLDKDLLEKGFWNVEIKTEALKQLV